jgi:hypothetical protein
MYKFELPPVEEALHMMYVEKQLGGVFDSSCSTLHNSAFPRMKGQPVPGTWNPPADVFIDTIPGLLHHKYFLVDADTSGGNKITATGSYNWETPAETGNDENMLVIHDARINNLYYQEFLARYHESGGMLVGKGNSVPEPWQSAGFSLNQNYPNPFATTTAIRFTIARTSRVKIVVTDLLGLEIQTLVNDKLQPGAYETSFDGSSVKSGVCFLKMSAGDYSAVRKMMVKK